jgi:DNA-directed RNA polymerase specialized sigma24 family protein
LPPPFPGWEPLILAARGGDREALAALFHHHRDCFLGILRWSGLEEHDALDALQIVIGKALRMPPRFWDNFSNPNEFERYWGRAMKHAAIDHFQRAALERTALAKYVDHVQPAVLEPDEPDGATDDPPGDDPLGGAAALGGAGAAGSPSHALRVDRAMYLAWVELEPHLGAAEAEALRRRVAVVVVQSLVWTAFRAAGGGRLPAEALEVLAAVRPWLPGMETLAVPGTEVPMSQVRAFCEQLIAAQTPVTMQRLQAGGQVPQGWQPHWAAARPAAGMFMGLGSSPDPARLCLAPFPDYFFLRADDLEAAGLPSVRALALAIAIPDPVARQARVREIVARIQRRLPSPGDTDRRIRLVELIRGIERRTRP